ncbi:EAL domain-containing protein [Modestobacter sp. I12A-02628]|uniref:EAL domain-containing protein n=1 Tax=Goekera deserti TaxID=2497753 RepID=A0A7K3WLZ7_9ACTN|nr:bifunctional diguanylate cyclase/phosphodiesterase [Goekera deserti]MPR00521.1 EAL domain-containing protein [Goekera deserti]NDI50457.1 EAL domain-containing protein [Goekera deserti]NEL56553.1 EAL domain-containing protein [Goekera deserti]
MTAPAGPTAGAQRAQDDPDELRAQLADLAERVREADRLRVAAEERAAAATWRADHDPLTGLPNRAAFLDLLTRTLAAHPAAALPAPCTESAVLPAPCTESAALSVQKVEEGASLSVLLIELDDFAEATELLGHAAGDQLLTAVAARLGRVLPGRRPLARVSGEGFALLVDDGADPAALGERVLNRMQAPFGLAAGQVSVRASAGVAELGPDAADARTLLARAAVAARSAQRAGGARLVRSTSAPDAPAGRDLTLREPLRVAVVTGAVELAYEPIISLRGDEVTLFEARVRWQHEGEDVPPEVFLPVAARSGLLETLTDQALEQVCTQLARWNAELGHRHVQVGTDVPAEVLTDPEFPDRVAACLARHDVDARQLVLEITEESLLRDVAAASAVTRRLRELGTVLALDEFGSGHSSLLHLQQITLDSLKVHRRFADDLDGDPAAQRFLAALLALGRSLGLKVIADGVQRPAQADTLRRLGCQHAQGPLFATPGPADELAWLLPAASGAAQAGGTSRSVGSARPVQSTSTTGWAAR